MMLEITSPEKTIYSGEVESVTVPGTMGLFTILNRHAPIISILTQGTLIYSINGEKTKVKVNGGFVEVKNNNVTVCIEQ